VVEEVIRLMNGEPAHNYSYNGKLVSCSDTAVRMMMKDWVDIVREQGSSAVP